jgi:hypothetical protein
MRISTISTFSDWANLHGTAGVLGIERIMDTLKVGQIDTVYWRAFDGGFATYPTRVARPQVGRASEVWKTGDGGGPVSRKFYQHLDARNFDALAEAARIGRERGIAVHAWFTLCEEDHGGPHLSPFGQKTHLRKHDREGRDYRGTLDFFYPEVREYKFAILDELLERGVAGVLFDFVRSNATPSGDANGIHRFGYNPEIRAAFKDAHGVDPLEIASDDRRWLAFKRSYLSDFVRTAKGRLGPDRRLSIMAIPDVDNANWLCLDLPALTADGTVGHVMTFGMTYDNDPQRVAQDYTSLRRQCHRRASVAAGTQAYDGLDAEDFDRALAAAEDAGAKEFVLYEADTLLTDKLLTSVRATHLKAPRRSRDIKVRSLAKPPAARDWGKAEAHRGFFIILGADKPRPSDKTTFAVLRSPSALHVRVVADGPQGEIDAEFVRAKKVFIDFIGARHWSGADRAHLFVDPGASRRNFAHFLVGRAGERLQRKRAQNSWKPRWTGAAQRDTPRRWSATFDIPFASLGRRRPKAGERWGFQVIREQAATGETSGWCVNAGRYPSNPTSWGDLIFA